MRMKNLGAAAWRVCCPLPIAFAQVRLAACAQPRLVLLSLQQSATLQEPSNALDDALQ